VEVPRFAVPVIVTVKAVVVVTVPPKVTRSVSFAPAIKITGLVANPTVRPVPPIITDERVTGPAKPAALIARVPVGRLPNDARSDAEPPEAKEILGPVGVPLEALKLKSCGLTMTVTLLTLF
jgi:hypothetical protein